LLTFLNPLFLLGLAGAAVPVLIHLSRRGTPERTVFPAAALLVASAQVVRRRRSPVEIVLLVLRMLVVAGFVIALARPRVPAWGTPRDEKTLASAAIVIDDTPSMGLCFAGGRTRMDEAKAAASAVLDRLAAGSVVRVQAASGLVLDSEVDLAAARAKLEAVSPSAEAVPLGRALSDAVKWLASAPAPRELYVISDFQRSSWEDAKRLPPWSDVSAHFVDVGGGAPADWGVTSVRVVEDRVFRKVPFELRVRVRAGSNATRELALSLAGRRVRKKSVTLNAGDETEVAFELAAAEAGPVVGNVSLEGSDAWPENDSRLFALEVLPAPEVLCVGAPAGDGRLAADLVALAFAPFPTGERELARVRKTQAPLPAARALGRFDCVVLAAPSGLGDDDWRRLARFVEDGGGVLAFADAGMAEDAFWSRARLVLAARDARLRAEDPPARLARLDFDHPVLRSFAEGANGGLGETRFRRFLSLELREGDEVESRPLAWYSRPGADTPALVESTRGRGRVLLVGSGPTQAWGTFYREPSFVPFLHESIAHLARAGPALRDFVVGERAVVHVTPPERGLGAALEDRDADPVDVRPLEVDPETLAVRLGRVGRRGAFHLVTRAPAGEGGEAGARPGRTRAVVFETDPRESEHELAEPEALLGRGASGAPSADALGRSMARTRGGMEITGRVLWATLVVLLAEMLLSAYLTRRRSNAPGQARNRAGAI
jgi:hypothetical protein